MSRPLVAPLSSWAPPEGAYAALGAALADRGLIGIDHGLRARTVVAKLHAPGKSYAVGYTEAEVEALGPAWAADAARRLRAAAETDSP